MTKSKTIKAIVPTNIALLKYWGKKDEKEQWPANDSLSITLNSMRTETKITPLEAGEEHTFSLNGIPHQRDEASFKKIFSHLDYLSEKFNFSKKLKIESINTFPTACGIASSASGFGALTLGALAAWSGVDSIEDLNKKGFSLEEIAHLARMGSGSAGRSVMGGFCHWSPGGSPKTQSIKSVFPKEHWDLRDTVVIIAKETKKISSTSGHREAWTSPLFAPRLAELPNRLSLMLEAIKDKDISKLGPLLEQEALEMHGVAMSCSTPVQYFSNKTSEFLSWIRTVRQKEKIQVYFTMDAGPNVHLICEENCVEKLRKILQNRVPSEALIEDRIGSGPHLQSF